MQRRNLTDDHTAAPTQDATPNAASLLSNFSLRPGADGKILIAGHRVPVGLALVGAGLGAVLLANRKTRGPVLAATGALLGRKTFAPKSV